MTDKLRQLEGEADDLRARMAALDEDRKPLRQQLGNLDRTYAKRAQELADVESAIETEKKAPRVSDHAVMRYLERTHGFSFEEVRKSLLTSNVLAAINSGVGKVKVAGGKLIIKDKTVVTFAADNTPKRKREEVSV